MERDVMEFDVVIVGAGPAGLSAACRVRQMSDQISVCVVEKGAEVGAHILSGAVLDPRALNELFPDWHRQGAPVTSNVVVDEFHYLLDEQRSIAVPDLLIPKESHNAGNYVVSLGNVCRWLAQQAEQLGVEIYPGFAATDLILDERGAVAGVQTGDMGLAADGIEKSSYLPGMYLRAKYTIFAEGCRGHLGKQLTEGFLLQASSGTQHYGVGVKEQWQVDPGRYEPGKVIHTLGWPLSASNATGGGFLYHGDDGVISLGLITDLNYQNPYLSPFEEMQRWKRHPLVREYLHGGERIAYGARALNKGGLQAIPELVFAGGMLVGCNAGFMNTARVKGSHNAMKTGMLAAESIVEALLQGDLGGQVLHRYPVRVRESWVYQELYQSRNIAPALHKLGTFWGGVYSFVDLTLFRGRLPFTLQDPIPDDAVLKPVTQSQPIDYPKPDGCLTFDRLSSVFLSNTHHQENQPCHLQLQDTELPVRDNLPVYGEPAQHYCPAGVYELVAVDGTEKLQINGQNCLHCKTCDIKDPAQNITWVCPEGGGGPNYPAM